MDSNQIKAFAVQFFTEQLNAPKMRDTGQVLGESFERGFQRVFTVFFADFSKVIANQDIDSGESVEIFDNLVNKIGHTKQKPLGRGA